VIVHHRLLLIYALLSQKRWCSLLTASTIWAAHWRPILTVACRRGGCGKTGRGRICGVPFRISPGDSRDWLYVSSRPSGDDSFGGLWRGELYPPVRRGTWGASTLGLAGSSYVFVLRLVAEEKDGQLRGRRLREENRDTVPGTSARGRVPPCVCRYQAERGAGILMPLPEGGAMSFGSLTNEVSGELWRSRTRWLGQHRGAGRNPQQNTCRRFFQGSCFMTVEVKSMLVRPRRILLWFVVNCRVNIDHAAA